MNEQRDVAFSCGWSPEGFQAGERRDQNREDGEKEASEVGGVPGGVWMSMLGPGQRAPGWV